MAKRTMRWIRAGEAGRAAVLAPGMMEPQSLLFQEFTEESDSARGAISGTLDKMWKKWRPQKRMGALSKRSSLKLNALAMSLEEKTASGRLWRTCGKLVESVPVVSEPYCAERTGKFIELEEAESLNGLAPFHPTGANPVK